MGGRHRGGDKRKGHVSAEAAALRHWCETGREKGGGEAGGGTDGAGQTGVGGRGGHGHWHSEVRNVKKKERKAK